MPRGGDSSEPEREAIGPAIHEPRVHELPEILAFKVCKGEKNFLAWIEGSLDKDAPFSDEEERDGLDETNY